jgi:hypothetical protein
VAAGVAALMFGAMVAPAMATDTITLAPSATTVRYGSDLDLQPSVTAALVVPGDKITLQIIQGGDWVTYGEGLQVEDTDTIVPQSIFVNEEVAWPATFRALWIPKSGGGSVVATSDAVTVSMARYTKTKVTIGAPKTVRARGASFAFTVSPVCAESLVKIWVVNSHGKTVTSTKILTDEFGHGSRTIKFGKAGKYKVEAQFLGNVWGKASTVSVKTVTAH